MLLIHVKPITADGAVAHPYGVHPGRNRAPPVRAARRVGATPSSPAPTARPTAPNPSLNHHRPTIEMGEDALRGLAGRIVSKGRKGARCNLIANLFAKADAPWLSTRVPRSPHHPRPQQSAAPTGRLVVLSDEFARILSTFKRDDAPLSADRIREPTEAAQDGFSRKQISNLFQRANVFIRLQEGKANLWVHHLSRPAVDPSRPRLGSPVSTPEPLPPISCWRGFTIAWLPAPT